MATTLVVRDAAPGDAEALAALSSELGYPVTALEVARRLARIAQRGDGAVLVAANGEGEVAGWVHVFLALRLESAPFAELGGLVVTASRHGSGVGRRLVAAAETWARRRGLDALRVRTNLERAAAISFYRHLGFAETKRQAVLVKPLG